MSTKSMKTIAAMVTGVALLVGYVAYALGIAAEGTVSLQSWAVTLLIFIGISAAAQIVIQILFHIALSIGIAVRAGTCDEKKVERIIVSAVKEDERDKFIGLKSNLAGYVCSGAGATAALIALAAGAAGALALHIAFGGFFVGAIAEGAARGFYYERGVRNG